MIATRDAWWTAWVRMWRDVSWQVPEVRAERARLATGAWGD